jgi:hypothetical protein
MASVSESIDAADKFTAELPMDGSRKVANLSIAEDGGAFVATISLQRAFPEDVATFHTVEQFTAPVEKIVNMGEVGTRWRVGALSGDHTSGAALCRLGF